MKAIFKHELKSYFAGLAGYVFCAFLLLFAGVFCMIINIKSASASFEYVLSNMSFTFMVVVPILTMRVIAEEKKQKTDQLLYALPVSMTDVVLGKYAATLAVLAVPTLIICFYPLILSAYGNVYFPAAFGSIVGFYFLGAALLAIGVFISSITESQAVAAGVCFGVMLLNYFLSTIASYASSTAFASVSAFMVVIILIAVLVYIMTKSGTTATLTGLVLTAVMLVFYIIDSSSFEGLFPTVMSYLNLFDRFNVFIGGVFDITGIVYFISVSAVFIFLSIQSMEKRRWGE